MTIEEIKNQGYYTQAHLPVTILECLDNLVKVSPHGAVNDWLFVRPKALVKIEEPTSTEEASVNLALDAKEAVLEALGEVMDCINKVRNGDGEIRDLINWVSIIINKYKKG